MGDSQLRKGEGQTGLTFRRGGRFVGRLTCTIFGLRFGLGRTSLVALSEACGFLGEEIGGRIPGVFGFDPGQDPRAQPGQPFGPSRGQPPSRGRGQPPSRGGGQPLTPFGGQGPPGGVGQQFLTPRGQPPGGVGQQFLTPADQPIPFFPSQAGSPGPGQPSVPAFPSQAGSPGPGQPAPAFPSQAGSPGPGQPPFESPPFVPAFPTVPGGAGSVPGSVPPGGQSPGGPIGGFNQGFGPPPVVGGGIGADVGGIGGIGGVALSAPAKASVPGGVGQQFVPSFSGGSSFGLGPVSAGQQFL